MTRTRILALALAAAGTAGAIVGTAAPSSAAPAAPAAVATSTDHGRTDFGFIAGSFTRDGRRYVRFDRALMLTGAAAAAAKAAHGLDPHDGPDYYVQNDNPRLRTYRLSPSVTVLGSQQLTGSPTLKKVPLQRLLDHLRTRPAGSTHPPFTLTFRAGQVVTVTEQYLP